MLHESLMLFTVTSGMSCRKSIPAANTFEQHGTKQMGESNGSIMLYYFFPLFLLISHEVSFETHELLSQSAGNFGLKAKLIVELCHAPISVTAYKTRSGTTFAQDITSLKFNKKKT